MSLPSDVTLKMEDMEWSVEEESNLTIGEKITNITFHSRLNTLVAVTSEFCVKIVDLQSGVTLQKSNLAGNKCLNINGSAAVSHVNTPK